jgi:hypothetical protein
MRQEQKKVALIRSATFNYNPMNISKINLSKRGDDNDVSSRSFNLKQISRSQQVT